MSQKIQNSWSICRFSPCSFLMYHIILISTLIVVMEMDLVDVRSVAVKYIHTNQIRCLHYCALWCQVLNWITDTLKGANVHTDIFLWLPCQTRSKLLLELIFLHHGLLYVDWKCHCDALHQITILILGPKCFCKVIIHTSCIYLFLH